jgi:hypothetical protein
VRLAEGWRARVGIEGLRAAVVQAFTAAAAVRLSEWAAGTHPVEPVGMVGPGSVPASEAGGTSAAPLEARVALMSRVWRDVQEYQQRLGELHASLRRVAGPDGQVVVAVRGGQLVDVELDPVWRVSASVADLERSVGKALSAALAAIAETPDLALAACPDLQALLTGSSLPGLGNLVSPDRATLASPPESDGPNRQQDNLRAVWRRVNG